MDTQKYTCVPGKLVTLLVTQVKNAPFLMGCVTKSVTGVGQVAGKLTELAVKSAKPAEKRYTLFDTGGLYLEVAPNGSKWWRFRYRINGKQKVMSFGVYPDVGLKNARDKRDAARTLIANGGDPLDEKKDSENLFAPLTQCLKNGLSTRNVSGLRVI